MKSKREEEFYELAGRELTEKRVVPGVWSKAFAKALGEPQATTALYITFRVEQLEEEFQERQKDVGRYDLAHDMTNFMNGFWIVIAFIVVTLLVVIGAAYLFKPVQ